MPQEPRGAYLLFRQALFEGDAETVYSYLDKDTKKVFDDRYLQMASMSDQIVQYLPQVDQKLARNQTGTVLLNEKEIRSGKDLFKVLFLPKPIEVNDDLELGTDVSEVEVNEEETEAAVVTYAEVEKENGESEAIVYRMVKEDDGIWRVTNWQEIALGKTKWVESNKSALEQTVSDLISEEREETKKIIKFIEAQEKKRRAAKKDK